MKLSIGMLVMLVALGGCNSRHLPREIIILPDISASIDPDAQHQTFEMIKEAASHLERGDSITIIPITSDAEVELQGQTLRYEIPPAEKREAYDGDLRKISAKVGDDLTRLAMEGTCHPAKHTDILGSTRVALKTFSSATTDKQLIILSDFIQDNDEYKFDSDRRLGNANDALALASDIDQNMQQHETVEIVMGRLKSTEYGKLPLNRRRAIDAFWGELFGPSSVNADGIFALHQAVSRVPRAK